MAPPRTPPPLVPDPYAILPPVAVRPASAKIVVDSLLETLSTREKVGQLLVPWLLGDYAAFESEQYDSLGVWIDSLAVGGIIISIGPPLEIAAKLNALQRRSHLPLLIAADLEWGTGMRLVGGTTFPHSMALGATGRELDAYELGRITALEARTVGIHLTFSPVADVNNNPENPIINTRSFGEDPEAAAELIAAYVRGAREHGLYTTAKHFPGHGDTDIDSHITLPVVRACWDRLDTLELVPFRAAVAAGVTAVMTAHVAVTCLEGDDPIPATLSPRIMTGVLQDSLGFQGLVVTDALTMGAIVQEYGSGESAVRAFLAGADQLLMPDDLRAAMEAMVAAVDSGRISIARLDHSVRKVLTLKWNAGLFHRRTVPLDSIPAIVGHRVFQDMADDIAARALTLVQRGPLHEFRERRGPVAMVIYAEERNLSAGGRLARELSLLGDTVTSFRLYPASGPLSYDSARAVIDENPRVIFATSVRVISGRGHVAMPDSLAQLILATARGKPTLLASFGSPYLLSQLPGYPGAYLVAWSDARSTEQAVARALAGGAAIRGTLPITLSPEYPRGYGIVIPERTPEALVDPQGAEGPEPEGSRRDTAWFVPERLEATTRFLETKVEEGAFPGGVLLVGHRGGVAFTSAVGRYGEDDARPVSDSTIYDLASLTKVIGLTTACMILSAEGKLNLDGRVVDYLPQFAGPGKFDVRIRHLLTHTSGLDAWVPLHLATASREEALARVMAEPLQSPPGLRYVYSDLGAIVLTQVVEAVAGEPLDQFLQRRVFGPLQMRRTRFRPPSEWHTTIAPTERDPWRGRVLRGEVHDENAARLGGVSGHAGLFSTAPDLARFATWLLDAYHDRLPPDAPLAVPANIIREFTRKQPGPEASTRALGWDTPSPGGRSSAGTMMSVSSFGHTGFTGTSIWIDPERELFVILLTNRVHPTRENRALLRIRGMVADSVLSALRSGGPAERRNGGSE
ncbi:MAG: serine hydrolase, partial [Gemmatimonadales bacterium]|nr:serine hydrolase [Gemmatimonadales bacterium]NIS65575.1 serine hydrolase [Gemmatimonadales bacterium]